MPNDLVPPDRLLVERLRQLPTQAMPPYHWQEFKRRWRWSTSRHDTAAWAPAAVAAALLMTIGAAALWSHLGRFGPPSADARRWAGNEARELALESWLASLPQEPVVVHVGTRAAVAGLEDQIAEVDDLLTSVRLEGVHPERFEVLQQERARLLGTLAQVRYAEAVDAASP